MPPSISSSPQIRTPSASRLPITLRTAATMSMQQAGPVVERPAVLVGAPVGGGGEEAAHDRRVAALQLDAVEAALGAVLGDQRVAGDDLVDLGVGDGLGHLAEQRVGDRRTAPTPAGGSTSRLAWPPLWLIWAKIGTRWRCTASVIAR